MGILGAFDPVREAIINPADFIKPVAGFPETVVSTFPKTIIDRFVEQTGAKEIAHTSTVNGRVPVYGVDYKGRQVGFFMSPVGAPAAACILEEVIAMGGRHFVYLGSCGMLERDVAAGKFIVPDAAARDEGTSHHYLPSEEEIILDPKSVESLVATLRRLGFQCKRGKTWTIDAIYRETREKVRHQKKQGCIVVEMECAALAAVAKFRNVDFAQFLFADDNLDTDKWEPGDIWGHTISQSSKYMSAAIEAAIDLSNTSK